MSLLDDYGVLDNKSKQIIYKQKISEINDWLAKHGCYNINNDFRTDVQYELGYSLNYKFHENIFYSATPAGDKCMPLYFQSTGEVQFEGFNNTGPCAWPCTCVSNNFYICKDVQYFRQLFSFIDIIIDDCGKIWVEPVNQGLPVILKDIEEYECIPDFKFRLKPNHYNYLLLVDCSQSLKDWGQIMIMYDQSIKSKLSF